MSPRFTILAVLLLGGSLRAADSEAPLAGYHLKNRSAFSAANQPRPPFWPIGWVHHDKATPQEVAEVKADIDAQMFSVSSILLGQPSLAVINGRAYSEGDLLHAPRAGSKDGPKGAWPTNARVRVQKIQDGSVTFISGTQTLTVPLRRPELNEHKSDKDELSLGQ
jgi:hypothetical protein